MSEFPKKKGAIIILPHTSFSHAQKPSRGHHAREIVRQTHGDHDNSPQYHDGGDEYRGPQPFEQDIGQGLEQGIRDEEDGDGGIVLAARLGQVQRRLEAVQAGVANVGSVEEGDQVEQAEPGDKADV